jgi:hypothetical protein
VIKGQVARILNARELVINRGRIDGVERGMRFAVMDAKGENVTDPETGKVLGSIHRPKVRVAVVQVEEHMSVARTYERIGGREGVASTLSVSRALFGEPSRPVTLQTDEEVWAQLDESQSYVKTGDPVEQISERIPPEPKSYPVAG